MFKHNILKCVCVLLDAFVLPLLQKYIIVIYFKYEFNNII